MTIARLGVRPFQTGIESRPTWIDAVVLAATTAVQYTVPAKEYGPLYRVKVWLFWSFLYVLVIAVGVLITVYAWQMPCDTCDEEGGTVNALKGFDGSPSIMSFRYMAAGS